MAELVRIQVDSRAVDAALLRMIEALAEPVPLLRRMGAVMERNIELRFETKTDPDGVPWQALADSTLESYKRRYDGAIPGSLLERTREMRNSLASVVFGGALEVGFGVAYAGWHVTGTKDGKLPRRDPLLGDWRTGRLGQQDEADLVAEIEDYLSQRF
jgi:phage gpG-like protein